ncbi:MAG: hypothetical protein ACYDBV_03310 [Nitrospiria bacterium]
MELTQLGQESRQPELAQLEQELQQPEPLETQPVFHNTPQEKKQINL